MSYDFNGSTQYLSLPDSSIFDLGIGGSSFTLAMWVFRVNNANINFHGKGGGLAGWSSSSTSHQYTCLVYSGTLYFQWFQNTGLSQLTRSAPAAGSWAHLAWTYNGTNLKGYMNGSTYGNTNTTFYKPTSSNITRIGRHGATDTSTQHKIADFGVWSVDLNASEISSLYKGFPCDKVRQQSLAFYAPLVRDLIDKKGAMTITNVGPAPVADHPRIYG